MITLTLTTDRCVPTTDMLFFAGYVPVPEAHSYAVAWGRQFFVTCARDSDGYACAGFRVYRVVPTAKGYQGTNYAWMVTSGQVELVNIVRRISIGAWPYDND